MREPNVSKLGAGAPPPAITRSAALGMKPARLVVAHIFRPIWQSGPEVFMTQLQGHLLAAAPHIAGVPQARAVVLVLGHSDQGSTGVVLNHPLNESLHRSIREMLTHGQTPALIHSLFQPRAENAEGAPAALPQITVGNTVVVPFGVLVAPAAEEAGGLMIRVMVGQVQWPAGQLEKELAAGVWLAAPSSPELIFGEHENLWQSVVRHIGDHTYSTALGVERLPLDPQWN
jgi:putative transcriptional regulator